MNDDRCYQARVTTKKMAAQSRQAIHNAIDTVGEHVSNKPIMAVSIAAVFWLLIRLLPMRKNNTPAGRPHGL